jgi:hypothetical protein
LVDAVETCRRRAGYLKARAYVMAAVAVIMVVAVVVGLVKLRTLVALDVCVAPADEVVLLADYRSESVLGVVPPDVTATPYPLFVRRYCDNVGVDMCQLSRETGVRLMRLVTGWRSAQTLFQDYEAVASGNGWILVRMGYAESGSCGLSVMHGDEPSCDGTGVLFCKVIHRVSAVPPKRPRF